MDNEEHAPDDAVRVMTAAAGASTSSWARHARTDIQASHSLTEPLARWAPERVEPPPSAQSLPESPPEFSIPESVLQARPPQRMPGDEVCRSPIAGLVVDVMAQPGEQVAHGQPILVIEAMKMQNYVSAPGAGIIKALYVAAGSAVRSGEELFELA